MCGRLSWGLFYPNCMSGDDSPLKVPRGPSANSISGITPTVVVGPPSVAAWPFASSWQTSINNSKPTGSITSYQAPVVSPNFMSQTPQNAILTLHRHTHPRGHRRADKKKLHLEDFCLFHSLPQFHSHNWMVNNIIVINLRTHSPVVAHHQAIHYYSVSSHIPEAVAASPVTATTNHTLKTAALGSSCLPTNDEGRTRPNLLLRSRQPASLHFFLVAPQLQHFHSFLYM